MFYFFYCHGSCEGVVENNTHEREIVELKKLKKKQKTCNTSFAILRETVVRCT
jgi:hypothetical protein